MLDDDELAQRVLMLGAELSYELRHGRDPEPVMRRRLRSAYDAGYRAALEELPPINLTSAVAVSRRVLDEVKRRIERRELKDQTILASAVYAELDRLANEIGCYDGP